MIDLYWPIVFAAMRQAAETKDEALAVAAAELVSARKASDAARHLYVCLRAYVGAKVGMVAADADAAPPTTPRGGPANDVPPRR